MAAALWRVPGIVATAHLCSPISGVRFGGLKRRIQVACIHRFIAVSNGVKESLCEDLRVPEAKIRIVRNGIQVARFDRAADSVLRRRLTAGRNRPIVLTPARLHTQKGHIYLLEAAALVPEAVFVLAGDGPERASLEKCARKLGLESRVLFIGQRDNMPQLLATCDLFVLP